MIAYMFGDWWLVAAGMVIFLLMLRWDEKRRCYQCDKPRGGRTTPYCAKCQQKQEKTTK